MNPSFARYVVAACLPFAAVGCGGEHNWISAPKVPTPVLLGPVDRVGGHPAQTGTQVGEVDTEALDLASSSTDENTQTRKTSVSLADSAPISAAVSAASRQRRDVDVHVDQLRAGGYVFLAGHSVVLEKWVGLNGRAIAKAGTR